MREFVAKLFSGWSETAFLILIFGIIAVMIAVISIVLGTKVRKAQEEAHQEYLETHGKGDYENREMRRFRQYKSKHKR